MKFWLFLCFLLIINCCYPQTKGTLVQINIAAPSLGEGKYSNTSEQPIAVYTPPSYSSSSKKFPVVYFLPGFGDNVNFWTNGTYQGFKFDTSMDQLIAAGTINEMIVVVVNGRNFMPGCFYVNSPILGNWEDFVINDVVPYVDSHYRTIPSSSSRALTGHSMGGFGALNLSMKHPDLFGVVYALSPGLFNKQGLKEHVFPNDNIIRSYINKENEYNAMSADDALTAFKNYFRTVSDWNTMFYYAYGAAMSPNENKNAPFINNPYSIVDGNIVVDSLILKNFESGFGNIENEVKMYKENLLKLKFLTFEYGVNDYYSWLTRGCRYFSQILDAEGINHNMVSFTGGHEDIVRRRIEEFLLPEVSEQLEYDTLSTGINDDLKKGSMGYKLFNYPNPFNPTTNFGFQTANPGMVRLAVYDILGNKVATLINEKKPAGEYKISFNAEHLSSGVYLCVLDADHIRLTNKILLTK